MAKTFYNICVVFSFYVKRCFGFVYVDFSFGKFALSTKKQHFAFAQRYNFRLSFIDFYLFLDGKSRVHQSIYPNTKMFLHKKWLVDCFTSAYLLPISFLNLKYKFGGWNIQQKCNLTHVTPFAECRQQLGVVARFQPCYDISSNDILFLDVSTFEQFPCNMTRCCFVLWWLLCYLWN